MFFVAVTAMFDSHISSQSGKQTKSVLNWLHVAKGLTILSWLGTLQVLWATLRVGGHKWLQADWLINLTSGPVRRGPFGTVLLTLADTSGIAPIWVVGLLQAIVVSSLFLCTLRLLSLQKHEAMAVAVFSAGFFAVLWTADAMAGLRKEMIALLAIVLLGLPGRGSGRLLLSAILIACAAWAHEAMVLLLPAWIAVLVLIPSRVPARVTIAVAVITSAMVFAAALYALRHPGLEDTAQICGAVTRYAVVHPVFCDGAIAWLAKEGAGFEAVRYALSVSVNLWFLPIAIVVAFAPLIHLCILGRADRRLIMLLVAAVLPIFLLFPIAIDWGRWISLQVSVITFLLLSLSAAGKFRPAPPRRQAVYLFWLITSLTIGLTAIPEPQPFAIFIRLVKGFEI